MYRKPTRANLYSSVKIGITLRLKSKLWFICGQDGLLTGLKFFQRIFKQNGYSERQALYPLVSVTCTFFSFCLDGISALVSAHSELTNSEIWTYRELAGLLGRVISPLQDRYLRRSTQTKNKRTQTSIPRGEFEPTIPVFERVKTIHTLGRSATLIGSFMDRIWKFRESIRC
jgi:hypothetical protein